VKFFGETEFWFAIIKVVAIIGMIVLGCYLLFSGTGSPQTSVRNLWNHGGFFPNGGMGLLMSMAFIMFSFGGLEMLGVTAAEASDPHKVIPKAINQVVYRILIFYVGALTVMLSLYPWDQLLQVLSASGDVYSGSPFVQIFSLIGNDTSAHILNFVVLTAALSVYNSGVYCNSRMLFGLAKQGHAPKAMMKLNKQGVPLRALATSALVTMLCVVVNYVARYSALELLFALAVASLMISWALISLTHIKFRKAMGEQGVVPKFKTFWFPFSNYLCLAFMLMIIIVMLSTPGIRGSVYAIPMWVVIVYIAYRMRIRNTKVVLTQ
jgi:AAT family amino acid transporter/aromatic amino acid transport protein AroP